MADTDDLLRQLLDFRNKRDWAQFHTPGNLAKSISIEAAELLECFQWREDKWALEAVKEEMADIYIYLLYLSHALKLDLNEIVLRKMEINNVRYPVAKSKGKADKHTTL